MNKKIISIDYGLARIGLAISDDRGILAFPIGMIQGFKNLQKNVAAVLKALEGRVFAEVVVGLPLLMNGKDSAMTLEVREFAKLLEEALNKKVILWDERLTSKEVEKRLIEGGVRRKDRTDKTDALAATLILQSYLDTKIIS